MTIDNKHITKTALSLAALLTTANCHALELGYGLDVNEEAKTLSIILDQDNARSGSYSNLTKINGVNYATYKFNDFTYKMPTTKDGTEDSVEISELMYAITGDSVMIRAKGIKSKHGVLDGHVSVVLDSEDSIPSDTDSLKKLLMGSESIRVSTDFNLLDSSEDGVKLAKKFEEAKKQLTCEITGEPRVQFTLLATNPNTEALLTKSSDTVAQIDAIGDFSGLLSLGVDGLSQTDIGFDKTDGMLDLGLFHRSDCNDISSLDDMDSLKKGLNLLPMLLMTQKDIPYTTATAFELLSFADDVVSVNHVSSIEKRIKGIDLDKIRAELEGLNKATNDDQPVKIAIADAK